VEALKEEPEQDEESLTNKRFSCKLCNQIFAQKLELLQHKFTHLQSLNIKTNNPQVKDAPIESADGIEGAKAEYSCPVETCDTLLTFQDLRSGAGVRHIIKMHNIYPSTVIKSKLYFKKV
jgi:hypothetical protein